MTKTAPSDTRASGLGALTRALALGLAVGAYFVVRYLGLWTGNDSARLYEAILGMMRTGSLTGPDAYEHGYAFSVWSVALSGLTGVQPSAAMRLMTPMIGTALVTVLGYVVFRRLLGSTREALLASAFLVLTPELVLSVSRGNHEKLTIGLTLIALLALVASFREFFGARRWPVFASWVVVYYVTAFVLVGLNVFFGSSFIAAATIGLLFASIAAAVRSDVRVAIVPIARRLVLPVATAWVLVVLVMFFVYPSAGEVLRLFDRASDRVGALLLTLEPESDPYEVTRTDWLNPFVYQILSLFRWIAFTGSFLVWFVLLVRFLRWPGGTSLPRLILIALYGAFGVQLASAMVVDLVGLEAGSNLQVRIYVYFALLAAPMFARGVFAVFERLPDGRPRRLGRYVVAAALPVFALTSMLKATLDPAVSNRWIFFRTDELAAVRFWDERHQRDKLWVGNEGRIRYANDIWYAEKPDHGNGLDAWEVDADTNKALSSPLIEAQLPAWRIPSPTFLIDDQVYDNGSTRIAHRIPATPFQR